MAVRSVATSGLGGEVRHAVKNESGEIFFLHPVPCAAQLYRDLLQSHIEPSNPAPVKWLWRISVYVHPAAMETPQTSSESNRHDLDMLSRQQVAINKIAIQYKTKKHYHSFFFTHLYLVIFKLRATLHLHYGYNRIY